MTMHELLIKKIANTLYINVQHLGSSGLLTGKAGIALFFYYYARFCNCPEYEEFPNEFIDSAYEKQNENSPVDFADGLAGFGWTINHLIENGFVETDEDDNILEEVDACIRNIRTTDFIVEADNEIPLFSKGLYFLARNDISAIKETLLQCDEFLMGEDLSPLSLCYLNSMLFFVIKASPITMEKALCKRLVTQLYKMIVALLERKRYTDSDLITLKANINRLAKYEHFAEWSLLSGKINISQDAFLRSGWNHIIYSYNTLENIDINDINNFVDAVIRDLKIQDLSLHSGLAGLGLGLMDLISSKKILENNC